MIVIYHQTTRLRFKLDQNNLTAKIIESPEVVNNLFIPRSIKYNSQEYLITEIEDGSFSHNFKINSIIFSQDSEIRSIGPVFNPLIQKITLPPKIEELKNRWCKKTDNLIFVNIPANNTNFKYLDDDHNIIVGKTNPNSDNYDIIVFANRKIKHFKVPSSITRIGPYSFERSSLQFLEFEENSKLTIIDHKAFNYSKLEYIQIPSSLKVLNENWLSNVWNDIQIELSSANPNFKLNEDKTILFGKSDPKNDEFDVIIRVLKTMENFVIPSYIKRINSFACICMNCKNIEFEAGSKLTYIGKYAFFSNQMTDISIPSTVNYIGKKAFESCCYVKNFNLPLVSNLRKLTKQFINGPHIKTLNIPRNIEELEDNWCFDLSDLIEVIIPPENKNFKYLDADHKIIVGKSNLNEVNFDVIHFACRDIEKVFIPKSIKYIKPSAFMCCKNLNELKFEEGSELKSIGKFSFRGSSIDKIEIPSSLELIDTEAFSFCKNLNTVVIPNYLQLKSIKSYSFNNAPVQNFFFPSKLEEVSSHSFSDALTNISISSENKHFKFLDEENKIIVRKSDQNNDAFDSIFFSKCDIEKVLIPSSIQRICSNAFLNCKKLKKVEFSKNSQLRLIECSAFKYSSIEELTIPSSVELFEPQCFGYCENLKKIDFEENSKLLSFSNSLFYESKIECISIPSSLKSLDRNWGDGACHLKQILISPKNSMFSYLDENHQIVVGKSNENENHFDVLHFVSPNLRKVVIPSTIKQIGAFSFSNCLIDEIFIPKSVSKISQNAFNNCKYLKKVEFERNSDLMEIEMKSFYFSNIQNFVFPEKMKFVDLWAFALPRELKSIEFLSIEVYIHGQAFYETLVWSFPNASKIKIDKTQLSGVYAEFRFFACANAEIFSDWSFLFKK